MRRAKAKLTVSTFPFLAVLLCAMGSLIMLLMVFDQRAKRAARQRNMQQAVVQARAEEDRWKKAQAALDADATLQQEQERALRARGEKALGELEGQAKSLATSLESAATAALAEKGKAGDLRARVESISGQLEVGRRDLAALDARLDGTKRAALQRERERQDRKRLVGDAKRAVEAQRDSERVRLERLATELSGLEKALKQAEDHKDRKTQTFSIIPYKGKRGEDKRPLYVECSSQGLIFHPDRLTVDPASEKTRLLLQIEDRARAQNTLYVNAGLVAHPRPFLMLLVRPDGIENYYKFQVAVKGAALDFGYELIDQEWDLDFPQERQLADGNSPAGPGKTLAANTATGNPGAPGRFAGNPGGIPGQPGAIGTGGIPGFPAGPGGKNPGSGVRGMYSGNENPNGFSANSRGIPGFPGGSSSIPGLAGGNPNGGLPGASPGGNGPGPGFPGILPGGTGGMGGLPDGSGTGGGIAGFPDGKPGGGPGGLPGGLPGGGGGMGGLPGGSGTGGGIAGFPDGKPGGGSGGLPGGLPGGGGGMGGLPGGSGTGGGIAGFPDGKPGGLPGSLPGGMSGPGTGGGGRGFFSGGDGAVGGFPDQSRGSGSGNAGLAGNPMAGGTQGGAGLTGNGFQGGPGRASGVADGGTNGNPGGSGPSGSVVTGSGGANGTPGLLPGLGNGVPGLGDGLPGMGNGTGFPGPDNQRSRMPGPTALSLGATGLGEPGALGGLPGALPGETGGESGDGSGGVANGQSGNGLAGSSGTGSGGSGLPGTPGAGGGSGGLAGASGSRATAGDAGGGTAEGASQPGAQPGGGFLALNGPPPLPGSAGSGGSSGDAAGGSSGAAGNAIPGAVGGAPGSQGSPGNPMGGGVSMTLNPGQKPEEEQTQRPARPSLSSGGGFPGDDDPAMEALNRLAIPLPLVDEDRPRAPRPLRMARLSGGRELTQFVECRAEGAVLHPGGQKYSRDTLSQPENANPLLQELHQRIQRRRALDKASDSNSLVQVRFLVWPDGMRTYHRVYPAVSLWSVPSQQQSINNIQDLREALSK